MMGTRERVSLPGVLTGGYGKVTEAKRPLDAGALWRGLLCLVLGGILFLFIRNNHLLAHGSRILWNIEVLTMLVLLSIPFVISLVHFFRSLQRR